MFLQNIDRQPKQHMTNNPEDFHPCSHCVQNLKSYNFAVVNFRLQHSGTDQWHLFENIFASVQYTPPKLSHCCFMCRCITWHYLDFFHNFRLIFGHLVVQLWKWPQGNLHSLSQDLHKQQSSKYVSFFNMKYILFSLVVWVQIIYATFFVRSDYLVKMPLFFLEFFSLLLQVGYYKIHPEIPTELSEKAKSFILCCFEPDPDKRATAAELLEDTFLTE